MCFYVFLLKLHLILVKTVLYIFKSVGEGIFYFFSLTVKVINMKLHPQTPIKKEKSGGKTVQAGLAAVQPGQAG